MDINCVDAIIYCINVCTESRTKQISITFILIVEQFCKQIAMDLWKQQFLSSYTSTNSFGGMLDDLFVWNGIGRHFGMYYSVHNFDGHKQELDRSRYFQPEKSIQRKNYSKKFPLEPYVNMQQLALISFKWGKGKK